MEQYQAPLFRGATKPVMSFGVPQVPLVLLGLPCLIGMIITTFLVGPLGLLWVIPLIIGHQFMKEITKRDDQYLNMWVLELRENLRMMRNRRKDKIALIPPTPMRSAKFLKDETL